MLQKFLFSIVVSKPGTYFYIALVHITGWSLITKLVTLAQKRPYQSSMVFKTIGAKSGQIRTCVLPYQRDGNRYFVVGSKGGAKTDPAWAINARANPSCWMYINRKRVPARAYVAQGEEHERIWQRMMDAGVELYREYQKSALPRIIPIVILAPLRAPGKNK